MLRFFNKRIHNRKGFTLIELIVVIAILGILAIIAIPRFLGMTQRAELQAIESTSISILNAAEVAWNEDLPTTDVRTTAGPWNGSTTEIAGLVADGYLRAQDYTGYTLTKVNATTGEFSITATPTP